MSASGWRNLFEPNAIGAAPALGVGPVLAIWIVLTIALEGVAWLAGFPETALTNAVERGAARAESRGIGELSDDLIRKAIQTQHETLPFWTTLARLGDFLVEPLALAGRALVVALCFSALAAIVGRPVDYERAFQEAAVAQGIWVLGLAVHISLMLTLRRIDVETSLALFLPPGTYPAAVWLAVRQVELFSTLGWITLARGGWRRGQVNLGTAVATCGILAMTEAAIRIAFGLVIGSASRLEATFN